jgi:hypothetical protein
MGRDLRKHKRLLVAVDFTWTVEAQNISGKGQLLDVSLLGAGFRIEGALQTEGTVLFKLHAPDVPALPSYARLRWSQPLSTKPPVYLCGVIFQEALSLEWSDWIHQAEGSADERDKEG